MTVERILGLLSLVRRELEVGEFGSALEHLARAADGVMDLAGVPRPARPDQSDEYARQSIRAIMTKR
jgi:hypothetical protein